jgi:hypothetical protein
LYFKKEACKEVDNDEIGKTTNVIDMAILSIMAMLSSIFTVVNLVELIDKLIVFEQISEILQSASVTFVSLLHMSYPFINMKNKKDKAKSSRYIAKLQQSITGYIIIGASVVLLNAHLLLAWQMDRDIDLKDKVGIISSLIMQKQTLHDDIQNESYGPKCRECRRLLSSGKIKYNKKNEKEFELSWEFKTDPQEVRKYQSTKNIANRSEMFLKNSYSRGVNTTTYKLRDIKNDKPK